MDEATDSVRDDTMLQVIKVEAFARSEVIWTGKEPNKLPVLVRVTAPARKTHRIGVDVVAVLDVSGSMEGEKLEELKKAMEVVIDELGTDDRLSIVSFDDDARRETQLTFMADQGRAVARATVQRLVTGGGTNMGAALQKGAQILSDRGAESISSSRVGCMIFLSDGDDKEIYKESLSNVFPAYTFGLGADHNPKAMKHIADETHGTYSFVSKDISHITNAFALFIAGLTSVAATSVEITLTAHEGTAILPIESDSYISTVVVDNCSGVIKIPDMYAGEQKNFIVYLMVTGEGMESLMTVGGPYQIDGTSIELVSTEVTVLRQRGGSPPGEEVVKINPEVAAELTRVELVRGISYMEKEKNDQGEPKPITSDGLQELWDRIKGSDDARATLEVALSKLEDDVAEMKKRIDEDKKSGLAYVLSWLSCHSWQRATTKDAPSDTGAFRRDADDDTMPEENTGAFRRDTDDAEDVTKPEEDTGAFRRDTDDAEDVTKPEEDTGAFQRDTGDAEDVTKPEEDTSAFRRDTNDAKDVTKPEEDTGAFRWRWLLPFLLPLLVVAVLVMAVMRYSGGGLDIPAAMVNTPALELSGHPGWPAMEQDLQLIVHKTDDVQFTSYFRDASPEDMNHQMDRYLYLAIVHATVLRRRSVAPAIPDKLAVRREAESYLQYMLTRMKHIDIPSFQDTSAEFITNEMNRYLYSTIVQASVVRSIYPTPNSNNEVTREGSTGVTTPEGSTGVTTLEVATGVTTPEVATGVTTPEGSTGVTTPEVATGVTTSETTVVDLEQYKMHMVQITKLEEQLRQKETQLVRMTELEELKAKHVTRITELELELQYREKLVVRMAEVEQTLQQKETIVVSLRSELKQQQESCAQRAAKVQVELKSCSQMAEKWKAMVVRMGGYIDDEDYYE